jgi:hypothetical protein
VSIYELRGIHIHPVRLDRELTCHDLRFQQCASLNDARQLALVLEMLNGNIGESAVGETPGKFLSAAMSPAVRLCRQTDTSLAAPPDAFGKAAQFCFVVAPFSATVPRLLSRIRSITSAPLHILSTAP